MVKREVKIVMTDKVAGAKVKVKTKPKQQNQLKMTSAAKYRARDEHEMFFRRGKGKKQKAKKKKKHKKRQWSDKERAKFAREHYRKHHESDQQTTPIKWEVNKILGHKQEKHEIDLDETIPFTPPTATETHQYLLNETLHRRNLKLL